MSSPGEYATAEAETIAVLLEGVDFMRANDLHTFDPDRYMDTGERDLYRRLVPELALQDGDDFTVEDVEAALDDVPLDVEHRHVFDVNLSAQGPTTWLRVTAVGSPGTVSFEVTGVVYHYSYAPDYQETPVQPGDPRWRFAVQAVERMVEGG